MHFELAFMADEPRGISMFAIDLGTGYGLPEKGYGTIMGLYIRPDFRRRGGTAFYKHIKNVLSNDGASKMYICPDAITGVPFWKANGYMDSGKIDPDARKPIYIKEIAVPADFTNSRMIALTKDTAAQISQWEYEKPFDVYNFKGRPNGYLMDAST